MAIREEGITIKIFIKYISASVILLLLLSACDRKPVKEKSLNEKLNFSSTEYLHIFKSKIISIDSELVKQDTLIRY
ncbi:MAG TPA: hypothetical protein VIZ21_07340, partial [Ignavibacteriaceae bacterium]